MQPAVNVERCAEGAFASPSRLYPVRTRMTALLLAAVATVLSVALSGRSAERRLERVVTHHDGASGEPEALRDRRAG